MVTKIWNGPRKSGDVTLVLWLRFSPFSIQYRRGQLLQGNDAVDTHVICSTIRQGELPNVDVRWLPNVDVGLLPNVDVGWWLSVGQR